MERNVLQNSALNIYENYFDDMTPELVKPRNLRWKFIIYNFVIFHVYFIYKQMKLVCNSHVDWYYLGEAK